MNLDMFGFGFYGVTIKHLLVFWIACAVMALILTRREKPGILGSALIVALGPVFTIATLYYEIKEWIPRFLFRTTFGVVTDADTLYKMEKVGAVLNSMAEAVVTARDAVNEQRSTGDGAVKREQRLAYKNARERLETALKLANWDGVYTNLYGTLVANAENRIRERERSAQESNVITPYRKIG